MVPIPSSVGKASCVSVRVSKVCEQIVDELPILVDPERAGLNRPRDAKWTTRGRNLKKLDAVAVVTPVGLDLFLPFRRDWTGAHERAQLPVLPRT